MGGTARGPAWPSPPPPSPCGFTPVHYSHALELCAGLPWGHGDGSTLLVSCVPRWPCDVSAELVAFQRHLRGLRLLQGLKTGKLPPCPSPHHRLGSFPLLFQARPIMGNTSPVVHSWGSCPSKSPLETSLHFRIAQALPRVISIYYCRVG